MNNNITPRTKIVLETDGKILEATYTGTKNLQGYPLYEILEITACCRIPLGKYVVAEQSGKLTYFKERPVHLSQRETTVPAVPAVAV
jgi:hypothetical protein